MKAIICSQCGSLIKNILPRQPIADCDYCGAKVIRDESFPKPESFDAELAKFFVPARVVVPRTTAQPIFLAIAVIGASFFLMFVTSFLLSKH